MSEPIRLSKRLAELLPCSRREAELYIENGWVSVAGQVVEEPQFKVQDEKIELQPDAVAATVEPVTLLLHKPAGYGSGQGANSVLQLLVPGNLSPDQAGRRPLKKHFVRQNLLTPLETDASGLMVFTQNWGVTRRLDHANKLEEEFIVEVSGQIVENGLKRLCHGLAYKGQPLPPMKVSWQNETRLRFALKGSQPGQIRHMCEAVGLKVVSMKRIRIGGVAMAKLQPGQWRYLNQNEKF
ncbi:MULTISPECIES: rRNA pseudouridine synthase [unclassified Pseudomonas]|uniref:rRNA pseudouridine synthase n=1 Tax=unclassified Pseudomonas TaxID=196821 RepID=UPI001BCFA7FB|nr:rRNA pseudouridine synthase [Pseudomonas sp. Pc102]BBP81831.1 RNA-binding protein S4 [Pseudomonas sp. Pc102]